MAAGACNLWLCEKRLRVLRSDTTPYDKTNIRVCVYGDMSIPTRFKAKVHLSRAPELSMFTLASYIHITVFTEGPVMVQ